MNWNRRSRLISYLRSSLWIVPVAAGLAERMFRIIVGALDVRIRRVECRVTAAIAFTS